MTHKMLAEKVPILSIKTSHHLVAVVLLLWFCFMVPAACLAAEQLQPSTEDRCAVCGMMVSPYPNWISVVTLKDNTHKFFDGPKDMFLFIFDLQKYQPGATVADITEVQVSEYYTLNRYDARELFFVAGSDILGPMGPEFVPVAGAQALKTFIKDHGHEKVMRFDGEKLSPVANLP